MYKIFTPTILFCVFFFTSPIKSLAQDTLSSVSTDLPEIHISAYSNRSDLIRIPAALQVIKDTLHVDHSFSLASVFNHAPGVRLEERSPGSYRLSIRGSTLRSPFGVRNVKVYLDGFSLSDGGGNTYLQLLSPELISKAELLKGPASSMYGAGSGGALLLSTDDEVNQLSLSLGSYSRWQESIKFHHQYKKWKVQVFQNHQQSQGYRQQSAMDRDLIFASQSYHTTRSDLKLFQLYGDLFYETPGGLNLDQKTADPRQARPAAGRLPGAVEQHASINNKTTMIGAGYRYDLSPKWSIDPKASLWYTDFRNPFITNYEVRFEKNASIKPEIKYFNPTPHGNMEWITGLEYLSQANLIKNFGNNKGKIDTLQAASNINSSQHNVFTQLQVNHRSWQWLAGLSLNQQTFQYKDRSASSFIKKQSGSVLMPRISMSYSISNRKSIFISAAKGNSPPTVAEIRPSSGEYNDQLLPESGWNLELGLKSYGPRWSYNINVYTMQLKNAIVRRNDAAGVEYFVNAGGADITGAEAWLKYDYKTLSWSATTAWQPYEFVSYKQRTTDFSGLDVTGVPAHTVSSQLNWRGIPKTNIGITWYYQSTLPLNDANTFLLPAYQLLNAHMVYDLTQTLNIGVSGENLLNADYSSGPDINAAVNRFYNSGPLRSVMATLKWRLNK